MPQPRAFEERGRPPGSAEASGKSGLAHQVFAGIVKFQVGLAVLLFLTAGTIRDWQAWVFWIVFGASMMVVSLYFLRHDPHLVAIRIKVGPASEPRREQKIIQTVSSVLVCLVLALPGVDYRMGWSSVPPAVVLLGDVLVALGFAGMFRVFQVNTFAAATVRVEGDQRVISTGPYGIVRHPMYVAAVVLFTGVPLALGSWWTLLVTLAMCGALVARILDEERFLTDSLPGYREYCQKVSYRLIPLVW